MRFDCKNEPQPVAFGDRRAAANGVELVGHPDEKDHVESGGRVVEDLAHNRLDAHLKATRFTYSSFLDPLTSARMTVSNGAIGNTNGSFSSNIWRRSRMKRKIWWCEKRRSIEIAKV